MDINKSTAVDEISQKTLTCRQVLKATFLNTQKDDLIQYIKDLEETQKINKRIISELCSTLPDKDQNTIKLLMDENEKLKEQNKKLLNKKLASDAEALILKQTVQSYKSRELETQKEIEDRTFELREQLNYKEYMLQLLEKKCIEAGYLILKHLHFIPEAVKFVSNLQERVREGKPIKITNLIEKNETLNQENTKLINEIIKLKDELVQIKENYIRVVEENETLTKENDELRKGLPIFKVDKNGNIMDTQLNEKSDFSFGGVSFILRDSIVSPQKYRSPILMTEMKNHNESFE